MAIKGPRRRTLLIIDDDSTLCSVVSDYFQDRGLHVLEADTARDGINLCAQQKIDIVLLDQKLPDAEGHTLCREILGFNDQTKIIFITAYPSFDNALQAIKEGAFDYLSKPFELEELDHAVKQALKTIELEKVEQVKRYSDNKELEETVLIGNSAVFAEVKRMVDLAGSTDAPVLITGQTGTGKNMVARAIHYKSTARREVFISINCATLPENLIEAELFGYEKGAFTGASSARKGVFEMADGGTLFLDEIGEMPLQLQAKLLSVLDEKRIKRLGGEQFRTVDVRIIAATNTDITKAVEEKRFREDLFYRLNVIRIHIPPLSQRREDIPVLCNYLLKKLAPARDVEIPQDEMERLMQYEWPGNVRELRNVIERALILQQGRVLRPSELLKDPSIKVVTGTEDRTPVEDPPMSLREVEEQHIRKVLTLYSNNLSRTARALGISLSTLKRKLKAYGIR